ncbi:MAG: glutathione S-transferase family protein [Elsteraceae bacterium]
MLKLYFSPGSCARASHIILEETGAPYQAEKISFADNQQRSPEFLKINPKGRVPALVTPHGILTESPAILAYVAQIHPEAKLAPTDPFEFAQAQSFNSYICSTVHVAHAHKFRGARWADDPAAIEAMKAKVPESVGAAFALIEEGMLKGPWVLGDQYSICDAYLFTVSSWLEGDGVDLAKLPKVMAHRQRVADRPATKSVLLAEKA